MADAPASTLDLLAECRSIAASLADSSRRLAERRHLDAAPLSGDLSVLAELSARVAYHCHAIAEVYQVVRKLDGYAVLAEGGAAPGRWHVHVGWTWGNLLLTADAERAALWPTAAAAKAWLDDAGRSRGADGRKPWPAPIAQLAGYEVSVVRVSIGLSPARPPAHAAPRALAAIGGGR